MTFLVSGSGHLEWEKGRGNVPFCPHSPLGVLLQVVQHGPLAVLEDQVQLAVPLEHLDQVDQVGMFELLQTKKIIVPSTGCTANYGTIN